MEVQGRRERKKSRTRASIIHAAARLMTQRGYQATTVADIAEEADVALSTVFAHFPTKDDIVFHFYPALFESFSEALRHRPAGRTTFDAFQSWVEEHLATFLTPENADLRVFRRIINTEEQLIAREHYHLARFPRAFAESLAAELGTAPEDPRPRILAGAAQGAILAVLEDLRREEWDGPPKFPIGLVRAMLEAGMRWTDPA
jgi:AcrR family transcriptional regulator